MLAKRIIPCLDVRAGRVVKGIKFEGLRDAGDPVERASTYERQGADEIVFLDITASLEERDTLVDLVQRTSESVFIPFTVGGGIRTVSDMGRVLNAGADKVSINTAAIQNPELIEVGSSSFGSQCIVVAIDARRTGEDAWEVYSHAGKVPTARSVTSWAREAAERGAGELLVTSIDSDGTLSGYDVELLSVLASTVRLPLIASGGAGAPRDFLAAFRDGQADAALAASIFHDGTYTVRQVKRFLSDAGIAVRPA